MDAPRYSIPEPPLPEEWQLRGLEPWRGRSLSRTDWEPPGPLPWSARHPHLVTSLVAVWLAAVGLTAWLWS